MALCIRPTPVVASLSLTLSMLSLTQLLNYFTLGLVFTDTVNYIGNLSTCNI